MFSRILTGTSTMNYSEKIEKIRHALETADAVVIGAGAGLSTSAGLTYSGERFERYFSDFKKEYGIRDMYSGGFYPYDTLEEYWAWWSRHIYVNRYMSAPKPVYDKLYELVKDKDYFVITTNVDHCFQKAGFDKKRLFYTQGDYGLWQCSKPCHQETYDNEASVREMLKAQGFVIDEDNELLLPEGMTPKMTIPGELVPYCPKCGKPMTMNLRCDDTFVQDEGWYDANMRYEEFLRRHDGMKVVYLELGVGANTPVIVKYPFWRMTQNNKNATYACINYGEAYAPEQISRQSVCIDEDIDRVVSNLIRQEMNQTEI